MISNKNLTTILSKSYLVLDLYNREMDRIAIQNKGAYKLDEKTQLDVSKKAFDVVCKESVGNVSYEECVAIFDIIGRR